MVENEEAMLLAIQRRQLAFHCASFSRDELHILDAYYPSKGLPHLKNRTAGYPERVSTLLHWRNIHSLLRYCHTRQPTKPLAVKIENTRLLPTFSVSLLSGKRSVQQNPVPVPSETRIVMCTTKRPSAALGAPVPSVSLAIHQLHMLRKPQCRSCKKSQTRPLSSYCWMRILPENSTWTLTATSTDYLLMNPVRGLSSSTWKRKIDTFVRLSQDVSQYFVITIFSCFNERE